VIDERPLPNAIAPPACAIVGVEVDAVGCAAARRAQDGRGVATPAPPVEDGAPVGVLAGSLGVDGAGARGPGQREEEQDAM